MPVTIENLSTLAIHNTNRTVGSGLPHATINFDFSGTPRTICLDDWINAKTPTITNIDAAITGQAIMRDNAKGVIKEWKCNKSLFEMFARSEYFQGQATKWHAPQDNAATHALSLHANAQIGTVARDTLFMLIVAGAAVVYYRETTIDALNVSNVAVTHPQPHARHLSQTTQVALIWKEFLNRVRIIARARINAGTLPPAYSAPALNNTYDTAMYDAAAAAGGGFATLIKHTVLRRGHSNNGYDWWSNNSTFLGSSDNLTAGVQGQLNAAFNHIRFVFYMEWRLGYELTTGTPAHA